MNVHIYINILFYLCAAVFNEEKFFKHDGFSLSCEKRGDVKTVNENVSKTMRVTMSGVLCERRYEFSSSENIVRFNQSIFIASTNKTTNALSCFSFRTIACNVVDVFRCEIIFSICACMYTSW